MTRESLQEAIAANSGLETRAVDSDDVVCPWCMTPIPSGEIAVWMREKTHWWCKHCGSYYGRTGGDSRHTWYGLAVKPIKFTAQE